MRGRVFQPVDESFLLLGPRGTGKSTWLRRAFPDALYIDLLEAATFRSFAAHPERLEERVRTLPAGHVVVVDEVQKVPALLDVVHRLIESGGGWRFALTGSSARKLRRGGVDLLAGRALLSRMHPFMACELGEDFVLEDALTTGLLPVVRSARRPTRVLDTYAALYVREEVQLEGLVRDIGAFSRFLEAVTFSHAAPINVSAIARECEVERKTAQGYLDVLEDLLLAFRVPVFTRRAQRATVARDKLYLFDSGVFRSLRPAGPLDRPAEIDGAALEGLVAQHVRAWIDYRGSRDRLYYWRTRGGSEVDLVVYGPSGFWAIEVKNTARIRPADLRGLRTFHSDYPEATPLLLYRGSDALMKGEVLCLSCDAFLRGLHPSRSLNAALSPFIDAGH